MSQNTYDLGQSARIYCLFVDNDAGTAYTPSSVFCNVRTPDGDVTVYEFGVDAELVNEKLPADVLTELLPEGIAVPTDATGQFRMYVRTIEPGVWYYRFLSDDEPDPDAAKERTFRVLKARAIE